MWETGPGRHFVYPGSPVSVTRRETGRRKVNLFEVGAPPREHLLDTPHFEEREVRLDPFAGQDPLDRVRCELDGLHPAADLSLTVSGYIDGSCGLNEQLLAERIRQITAGRCTEEPRLLFRDIRALLEDDLFQRFQAKLSRLEVSREEKRETVEQVLRAMMEASLC